MRILFGFLVVTLVCSNTTALATPSAQTFVVSDGTKVGYQCFGPQITQAAKGSFSAVASQVQFHPMYVSAIRGHFSVTLRSITTDDAGWDTMFRNAPFLDLDKYPAARFDVTDVKGPLSIAPNAWSDIILVGDFSFHGVTQHIEVPSQLFFTPAKGSEAVEVLEIKTTFPITWQDYKVAMPEGSTRAFAGDGANIKIYARYRPTSTGKKPSKTKAAASKPSHQKQ